MEMRLEDINKVNKSEDLNLPELTLVEAEAQNFKHYVANELDKRGEISLVELINTKNKKIMSLINLGTQLAITTGNQAEIVKRDKFDVNKHMEMRATMLAEELIKNKKEYLN